MRRLNYPLKGRCTDAKIGDEGLLVIDAAASASTPSGSPDDLEGDVGLRRLRIDLRVSVTPVAG
jgi:hypothetical protein